jgi:rhodanese-related sulfurtransferase
MIADITQRKAKQALTENARIKLIDVRSPQECSRGYIAGALNIPIERIGHIEYIIPDKDAIIYLYCKTGVRSHEAREALADLGYVNAVNIGGIRGWDLVSEETA